MRLGVRVPPCRPLPEIASVVQRAEAAGFDTASMPDCPTLWRDTMLAAAHTVAGTERITVSTAVSNVVTRTPIGLASEARSIGELAPGRFRLTIGAGQSSVQLTAQRPSTNRELREGVEVVTRLLAGETVAVGETAVALQDPPSQPIPVHLAADGPRNLSLAPEIADGVMTVFRDVPDKLELLGARQNELGRTRPFHKIVIAITRVTDDMEYEIQRLKPFVARIIEVEGPGRFESAGFAVEMPRRVALADGTDLGHPREVEEAIRVASQWISDEMATWCARNLCLIGSGEEIVERLLELSALGVDEVLMSDGGSFVPPTEMIDRVGAEVIPELLRHRDNDASGAP